MKLTNSLLSLQRNRLLEPNLLTKGEVSRDNRTSLEKEFNIMTLRELYSFPPGIQVKLPKEGETILSTRLDEVAFYEAAFHASLQLPIHPTIRKILNFYNICPAQLSLNAWRSVVCVLVVCNYYN